MKLRTCSAPNECFLQKEYGLTGNAWNKGTRYNFPPLPSEYCIHRQWKGVEREVYVLPVARASQATISSSRTRKKIPQGIPGGKTVRIGHRSWGRHGVPSFMGITKTSTKEGAGHLHLWSQVLNTWTSLLMENNQKLDRLFFKHLEIHSRTYSRDVSEVEIHRDNAKKDQQSPEADFSLETSTSQDREKSRWPYSLPNRRPWVKLETQTVVASTKSKWEIPPPGKRKEN